jgi:hypothetical protein
MVVGKRGKNEESKRMNKVKIFMIEASFLVLHVKNNASLQAQCNVKFF